MAAPAAADPAASALFHCTYADCSLSFNDEDDRAAHKDMEHDYCRRCNVDFPNYETLLKHKIESVKHVVCPICGMEFGTVSGRDQHVLRSHPIDHEIKCPFGRCDKEFKNPSGYISHIEKGKCVSGVNKQTILVRRDMKVIESDMAYRAIQGTFHGPISQSTEQDADSDGDGGVSVLQDENQLSLTHQPREDDGNKTQSLKFWPLLGADNKELPADGVALTKRAIEQTAVKPSFRPTPVIPRSGALKVYKTFIPRFNENQYVNEASGKFECCKQEFATGDQLATHLLSHRAQRFICPMCRKSMQSVTALVSHAENSQKCGLSRRSDASAIMAIITGGLVTADRWIDEDHYHLKYEAATHF